MEYAIVFLGLALLAAMVILIVALCSINDQLSQIRHTVNLIRPEVRECWEELELSKNGRKAHMERVIRALWED